MRPNMHDSAPARCDWVIGRLCPRHSMYEVEGRIHRYTIEILPACPCNVLYRRHEETSSYQPQEGSAHDGGDTAAHPPALLPSGHQAHFILGSAPRPLVLQLLGSPPGRTLLKQRVFRLLVPGLVVTRPCKAHLFLLLAVPRHVPSSKRCRSVLRPHV